MEVHPAIYISEQERAIKAPADQLTPRDSGPLRTQATVSAPLTEPMKDDIWSAVSTLPPKVSISKMMKDAPFERAVRA